MDKNRESLLERVKSHRRQVINLLEESARLHESAQTLTTYAERVAAQKRIIALNEEAFAEKALADELIEELNREPDKSN